MKTVKLVSCLSYRGHGVNAVKGKELQVTSEKADELVATGFFEICGDCSVALEADNNPGAEGAESKADDKPDADETITAEKIRKMKKAKLEELAKEMQVDLEGCKNDKERQELLVAALEADNNPGAEGAESETDPDTNTNANGEGAQVDFE